MSKVHQLFEMYRLWLHMSQASMTAYGPCSMQTVAEKKAWELSKKEGFELATIMPSLVLGPVTGTRPDGTSINAMKVCLCVATPQTVLCALDSLGCDGCDT